jgi:hypothetical protein
MKFLPMFRRGLLSIALLCAAAVPAWATPGQAALVSPTGEVTGSTIVFTWNAVSDSTWYLFWVGTPTQGLIQQWYTAGQAGCASGLTCSVSLTLGFAPGPFNWYIQTYGATGYGPWSGPAPFSMKDPTPTWTRKLSSDRRFALVLDGAAVLDNETGLTWDRNPTAATSSWGAVGYGCMLLTAGGRQGWRLPSLSELLTLSDPSRSPGLPAGNPFNLGALGGGFWTQTNWFDSQTILLVDFNTTGGGIFQAAKTGAYRGWCVRGNGSDRQQ